MFCPKCKAEYRTGFTVCADCHVALIEKLDPEPVPGQKSKGDVEYIQYTALLSTFNLGDIAVIKSILDGEKITYYVKGENFHMSRPGIQPAIVMVKSDQIEKAADVLKDLDLTFMMFS